MPAEIRPMPGSLAGRRGRCFRRTWTAPICAAPKPTRRPRQWPRFPRVRAALLDFQREFGARTARCWMGGISGRWSFRTADLKLFVTASPEARAHRRWLELQDRGVPADPADVERDIRARDAQDAARAIAPLRPAEDAVTIDTTTLDREAAFAAVLRVAGERFGLANSDQVS